MEGRGNNAGTFELHAEKPALKELNSVILLKCLCA